MCSLALSFTEAKTTLLSFKGKEDINLDINGLSDYPQRLATMCQWFPLLQAKASGEQATHLVCG